MRRLHSPIVPFRLACAMALALPLLLAPTPATTMTNQTKRIDAVPVLTWEASGQTTFCGALSAALSVTDRPRDYATLMGDTGLAFRLRWWVADDGKGWSMSSPVGEFPTWIHAAEHAIGWSMRWETHLDQEKTDMSRFKADVVRSLDAGLPVLVYGKTLDLGVVYGYESAGDVLLVRDYFDGPAETKVPLKETKGLLAFLDKKTDAPTRHDAVLAGLRVADADWRHLAVATDRHSPLIGTGSYHFGGQAYDRWIDGIRQADTLTDEQRKNLFAAGWWTTCVLIDARQAAARYLRRSANELDGPAAEDLLAAAESYDGASRAAAGAVFGDKAAFLGPWSGKSTADWSPAVREREVEILTKLKAADNEAIARIRSAID